MIADSRFAVSDPRLDAADRESRPKRQQRQRRGALHAVLVAAVPLGALAALAGAHPAATLPILAGAGFVFLAVQARIATGDVVALDVALLALAAAVLLQAVPLPAALVATVSPHLEALRSTLFLDAPEASATLSLNPAATRAGLASLASALFVFWAGREAFARRGLRKTASAVAGAGFVLVIVTLIQRTTSPRLLLWTWTPPDPEAMPFGPFVNRNHLATWLLMAASLTAGYLVSHTQAIGAAHASLRLKLRDWLADGKGLLIAGALLVMLLGIAATLSRAALLGAGAALMVGFLLTRGVQRGRTAAIVGGIAAVLLAAGIWSNANALARKFESGTALSRITIWRHSLPAVRDFWAVGTGTGTYGIAMLHYQEVFRDVHFNQAHSEYVQTLAEGGALVGLPLVAALVAGVRLARRRLQDTRAIAWLRVGAAAGLAGAAVQGIFETGMRMPANALLAAVLAAIVLHEPQER